MPIRMTPDEGQEQNQGPRPSRGGGGSPNIGGGGLIGMLLPMLFKNPKLLLILLVVGGLFYFMGGSKGCAGGGGGGVAEVVSNLFNKGATLDPKEYDKAEVFEPLADNVKNPLPEKVSLEAFAPPRLNQGQQGSCVAWASAYAARSIVNNAATKQTPTTANAFSPSFLYNQIKIENSGCQGSYLIRAMENMKAGGVAPFSKFAYDDQDCSRPPTEEAREAAKAYRIKGFQRLSATDDPRSKVDMLAMKQQLDQGAPVVIGMMVGGSFMQEMEGQEKWYPNESDYQMHGFGGHAMCVIGYDDFKFGQDGGFQIMNSWGDKWGKNGIAWVSYNDFAYFAKEAYAVYPQGEGVDVKPSRFDLRFGLAVVDAKGKATGENIPLTHVGGRVFRTVSPIAKGTRFKIEVTNKAECYTYIFGEETDGSTYTLFPYTPKHSPYCGITGTRVFPSDQSLTADEVGTTDVMAIVVYNQPVDYPKVNEAMKQNPTKGLGAKLSAVLGTELMGADGLTYTEGATFGASGPASSNAVAFVLEVTKR
ncbi:MAG TPA: C1 family peptidase [Flavobacteriales bacterium]|nr:C1 family peptidase [Flavobacteriales bacterium]